MYSEEIILHPYVQGKLRLEKAAPLCTWLQGGAFREEAVAHLLMQGHKEFTIQLQWPDRDICLRMVERGMVWDHGGLVSFMAFCHPDVEKWEKEIAVNNEHLLEIEDPITKTKMA